MEVDSGFEILDIPECPRSSVDGYDFAVQPLGHPIGYGVLAVAQDILQQFMDHGADPFDWLQADVLAITIGRQHSGWYPSASGFDQMDTNWLT
jgi:hypothetical protein